jgi:F-type H+-transporting ATPase subunit alpha
MPSRTSDPILENALDNIFIPSDENMLPSTFEYDPLGDQKIDSNHSHKKTTFTQVLDFAFPDEVTEGVTQIGEVIYIGDGVCKVTGLDKARIEDIITVKTSSGPEKALILGIEDTHIESVVLGNYANIKQGDQVIANNSKLQIPVGETLLGRVINPLGEPIDFKGPVKGVSHRDVEFPAPSVMNRFPIYEPLITGVLVVDTTIPIGKGQRELVIGDRKTGKSRLAIDMICNQKNQDIFCVYVGVGIQAAKAKATLELLESRGAMKYTTMVIATSDDPPSLQYIAPYVGTSLAEYFMYKGKHALIVYDDLSKQAKAYRQVSLLLKRSPGRDAYPGDIFFLHSRLLERVSKVSPKIGAGSITALPIAETQSGDVSDYIITNLMSITDGHIFLDANMMHDGILPAVNSGTSVSRIGSKVQIPLLKKIGELTSRTLARYEEVRSFETINTEVAEETLKEISRGKQMKEMLAQPSDVAYSYDEQVVFLYLATQGKLDIFELNELTEFKSRFLKYYRENVDKEFIQKANHVKNIEDVESDINSIFEAYLKKFGKAKKPE